MNNIINLLFLNSYKENDKPSQESRQKLPDDVVKDLNLEKIAREILPENHNYALDILTSICDAPEVINYRLDILTDFINIPELEATILDNIDSIYRHERLVESKIQVKGSFTDISAKVAGIENYISYINSFHAFYCTHGSKVKSQGILKLLTYCEEIYASTEFESLKQQVAELKRNLTEHISSITIGINFDELMRPAEAVLLSVGTKPLKEKTFISRLLGQDQMFERVNGISPFHKLDPFFTYDGVDGTLFKDLKEISRQVLEYFAIALKSYYNLNTRFLLEIEAQLKFYMGAARMIRYLQSHGLAMCRPAVVHMKERIFEVKDMTDMSFAIKLVRDNWKIRLDKAIITNDVVMGEDGRIFLLTGPNQGGKTTYARAIGICQVLMQAGLYIPGSSARISPVDWVFTHFPKEEVVGVLTSRLSEECRQFSNTFKKATCFSLILMNESISSTSPSECLYIAEEIIKSIRHIGSRAVFATHLLDLVNKIEGIHYEVSGSSNIVSMVAGIKPIDKDETASDRVENIECTYKVVPNPPLRSSYAKEIVDKYGISFNQIAESLKLRQKAGNL